MIIIYGTRGITFTSENGLFHCPSCKSSQNYRFRVVRRFFTLFFIPIIPLDKVGEYVECNKCSGTYKPLVLEQSLPDDQFQVLYQEAMQHSLIKIMLADGKIEQSEKNIIVAIINRLGKKEITESDLEAMVLKIKEDKNDLTHYLKQVRASLNENGKELIIKGALLVSLADGDLDNSERELIIKMGRILELSSSKTNELIKNSINQYALENKKSLN